MSDGRATCCGPLLVADRRPVMTEGLQGRTLVGMEFTRSHGTANDFVVLADLDDRIELSEVLVRALTDRRRGVGGDGAIRIAPGSDGADAFMDYRNADGSIGEMCGNGVRVVAKHLVDHGFVAAEAGSRLLIGTRGGPKPVTIASLHPDGRVAEVTVDMGPPVFDPAEVPFDPPGDRGASAHRVDVDGTSVALTVASMGNPHGVLLVDDVGSAPVTTLGPKLETHQRFPAKANIGFAQVLTRSRIRLRVWERGVGETAACGTGACAAVASLQRLGHVDGEVAVELPGGTLTVAYEPGGNVMMTGPAVEVGSGTLDDAWLSAANRGDLEVGRP